MCRLLGNALQDSYECTGAGAGYLYQSAARIVNSSYEERLDELRLLPLEQRRLTGGLTDVYIFMWDLERANRKDYLTLQSVTVGGQNKWRMGNVKY